MQLMEIDALEDSLLSEWYSVSRLMHQFIPFSFPYLTFQGFAKECKKAADMKQAEETGRGGRPHTFGGQ